MPKITPEKRNEIEDLIYSVFDAVDKTGTNADYYRSLFAGMTDDQFYNFLKRRLPFRFHTELFKIEPKMYEISEGFKVLNKPMLEKLSMPHVYVNEDGKAVQTKECDVVYIHIKRLKQTVAKKTAVAIDIDKRDMRTGLLVGEDKGGKESDKEFESMAVMDLNYNIDEMSRSRADSLRAVTQMNNIISTQGYVSQNDIEIEKDDSLSKNMLNVYLIGANIHSNLVDTDYMTPYTARNKKQMIERK